MNYQPCVGASGGTAGEAAGGAALTKSFNSLLGLKKGMRLGGTSTLAPVLGFRRGRTGRNPKTGAKVEVPPKRIPFFKPSKELKDFVNAAPPAASPAVPPEAPTQG